MDSFLDQFYAAVGVALDDPAMSKRLTPEQKLIDLRVAEKVAWEELSSSFGGESNPARAEAIITIESSKTHYRLPGNFRQFISFEYRDTTNPDAILDWLPSIPMYDSGPGVEILSEQRGMILRPIRLGIEDQDWTLSYWKGPVILHNATTAKVANMPSSQVLTGYTVSTTKVTKTDTFTAAMVGETVTFTGGALTQTESRTITDATADYIEFAEVTGLDDTASMTIDADWCWLVAGTPGTDGGSIITIEDYYNGSMLKVYDSTAGYPQVMEILDYYEDPTTAGEFHFQLRHSWSPLPTGTVKYEIRPLLPDDLDRLYAVDVALMHLTGRTSYLRRQELSRDRKKLLLACRSWLNSNVADRIPTKTAPPNPAECDPYD